MTTEEKHRIIDQVHAAMDKQEPSYVEWCSDGNDPTDHLWYLLAAVLDMLVELEGEQS
jgi:hypothetical protein